MDDWLLKQYDGMPLHHVPQEHHRALERAQQARDRREAASGAGHPEWADLPASADAARRSRATHWFSGEECSKGHVSPRTLSGDCQTCLDEPSPTEALWLARFANIADRMIETGCLHYAQDGRVVETRVKVKWPNVREACEKAARLTARDGRLRCVVNGATRMVVKLVAR